MLFGSAVIIAIGARMIFLPRLASGGLYDDGYITLRYAANIAAGRGFVYNPGESVWGTTTPLFTLVLSAAGWLFSPGALELTALAIGLAASVCCWCLLAAAFESEKLPRAISIPILLVLMWYPPYIENSLSGMETPLVLALMAASLWSYTKDRPYLFGVTSAFLVLARIDTLVWVGVFGVAYMARHYHTHREALVKALAAFAIAVLPWHIYAYATFHTLIPQSVVGKAVSHDAFSSLDWAYFVRFYHVYYPIGRLGPFAGVGIAVTLSLMLLGFWDLWAEFPLLRPLGVYFLCFVLVFFCSKTPLYMWYFPPTQWIAILLACFGLRRLWDRWLARNLRPGLRIAPFAALAVAVVAYGIWGSSKIMESRSALRPWAELGDFIRDQTPPESKVFLEHIGIVGFRSNRPILDNMGLVSPEIIELKRANPTNDLWLRRALRQYHPDVVVLYSAQDPINGQGQWDASDRDWFGSEYKLVRTVEGEPNALVYFMKK
jgi:hypothetical protein